MGKETVYKYRKYDITIDDYVYSTRYATMHQINRIEADLIYSNAISIDTKYLTDGWK